MFRTLLQALLTALLPVAVEKATKAIDKIGGKKDGAAPPRA